MFSKKTVDELTNQLSENITRVGILRGALRNSDSLLRTLGTPDDRIVQMALAENEKALAETEWSE